MSVTKSITDDFLTCRICFEVFTDPRILPCLHTYCFQCICSHVDTSQTEGRPVVCPECREPFPATVCTLKTNFFINGLADVLKEKSGKNIPCTICRLRGRESQADVKCLDCGDHLCSQCGSGHHASSLTWNHQTISLDDIKKGKYDDTLRKLQKIFCSKHEDKEIEFFCLSCLMSVCLTCVIVDHRDHKCKTISDVVKDVRPRLTELTGKLQVTFCSLSVEEDAISVQIERFNQTIEERQDQIEHEARLEIEKINSKKTEALENLSKEILVEQEARVGILEELANRRNVISSCIEFSDNILTKGKDEEIIMLEGLLTERLAYLKSTMNANASQVENFTPEVSTTEPRAQAASYFLPMLKTVESTVQPSTSKTCNLATKPQQKDDHKSMVQSTETDDGSSIKLILQRRMSASSASDSQINHIKGMVYSHKHGLIVSDNWNRIIKFFSTNGELKRQLTIPECEPQAVAITGDTIGTISENYLFLVDINGDVKKKIKISDKKPNPAFNFTYSLAAAEAGWFVVGNIPKNRLIFFTKEGKFSRYLYCDVMDPLASISVTPRENLVLSEWGCGRVRVISPSGKHVLQTRKQKWKPNGTCASSDGTIFGADFEKGQIVAISSTGNHLMKRDTSRDGIRNPKFLAMDESSLLYLADNQGNICVYKIVSK